MSTALSDIVRELMQATAGHYAVPTAGDRWHIYMQVRGGSDRMVATRSSEAAALALIRQRRDAWSGCEIALGRPTQPLTLSGS